MENMGKHEYMKSMNVKTWMFFWFGKKKAFTHMDRKKKKKEEKPDWPTLIFLCYGKQTYFFYA